MSSTSGFSRSRYLRLMAISSVEVFATVPLATYFIVTDAKAGIGPWKSWAYTHSHYSVVEQVAGFVWKRWPLAAAELEIYRWSLIACAFIFFALFGFAVEAREQYYHLYKLLTRRIGTSSSTPHHPPHAYVVFFHCFPVLIHWGSLLLLQYSISPLCQETRKRWRHGSYPSHVPNGSGKGQFECLTHTHRPTLGPVRFYGKHS
jgi:Pheromone A receptor